MWPWLEPHRSSCQKVDAHVLKIKMQAKYHTRLPKTHTATYVLCPYLNMVEGEHILHRCPYHGRVQQDSCITEQTEARQFPYLAHLSQTISLPRRLTQDKSVTMQTETRQFPYHANREIHLESSVIPQAGAKQFLRHIHPSHTSFLPRKLKLSRRLKQDKQLSMQTEARTSFLHGQTETGQCPYHANKTACVKKGYRAEWKKTIATRCKLKQETSLQLTTHTKARRFPYHANQKIHANILVTMQTEARSFPYRAY